MAGLPWLGEFALEGLPLVLDAGIRPFDFWSHTVLIGEKERIQERAVRHQLGVVRWPDKNHSEHMPFIHNFCSCQ